MSALTATADVTVAPGRINLRDQDRFTLQLRSTGGQPTPFQITFASDWFVAVPAAGTLGTVPVDVEVRLRRFLVDVGSHTGTMTLVAGGVTIPVPIDVKQDPISPQLLPWLEYAADQPQTLDHCVAGLLLWRRLTDTAIVSTSPWYEELYPQLRARVPGMRLIPGVKVVNRIPGGGYIDVPSLWNTLAADVRRMRDVSGDPMMLVEAETPLGGYWTGAWDIDFGAFDDCIRTLPTDLQYLWYPGMVEVDQQSAPLALQRCLPYWQTIQDELPQVRFLGSLATTPWTATSPWRVANYEALAAMARERPIPYAGFGFWNGRQYWESWQIFQIFGLINTHECIIYPGQTRWQQVAREMALLFHPDEAAAPGPDMDCDGLITYDDIDPFLTAMINRSAYESMHPLCHYAKADVNQDGAVNFDDIDAFVDCMIGGCAGAGPG